MRSVLILDDYLPFLRSAQRQLKGRTVFVQPTADGARKLLESTAPDLAIIDHQLAPQDPSGLEVLREIKSRWPKLRTALYSVELDLELAIAAIEAGADHAFPKDVDVAYIVARFEGAPCSSSSLSSMERVVYGHVKRAVDASGGNLTAAGKSIGLSRETVRKKISSPPKR